MVMQKLRMLGTVAVLATSGFTFVANSYAQTQGMERRDDRRDTRAMSRATKQTCKAGDKSNAECRQAKRTVKQQGRHGGTPQTAQTPPAGAGQSGP